MTDPANVTTFQLRKDDLTNTRVITAAHTALQAGQIRVHIDKFALTSNNITYAAFGDFMSYWQFYPTGVDGWGVIPVWGFGNVVESLCDGIATGERLYGYWPMASHTVLTPARLNEGGFSESAPNRAKLHALYNVYLRTRRDPFYTPATEDLQALLRPLFVTSFVIDDFLADNAFFGATTMLLSSASSKTAYGTAYQLFKRPGVEVIGLTSERNRSFCESLGCYHRVVTYEELATISADTPCVYIDFAGNAGLRAQVHTRFTALAYSSAIGATHVNDMALPNDLHGPAPVQFFAPSQIKKRQADWGHAAFGQHLVAAWSGFCRSVAHGAQPWLSVQQHHGVNAVQRIYPQVLGGHGDARIGHVLAL